jgi:hypothetical protein
MIKNVIYINKNRMMVPFDKELQMQMPNENMGEPPAKPQGDFRPEMSNNI